MNRKTRAFFRKLLRLEKRKFIVQYTTQQTINSGWKKGRFVVTLDHDEEWTISLIQKLEKELEDGTEAKNYKVVITGFNTMKG